MCQIFAGKSNKIRATLLNTPGLMADLFSNNGDGLGAMYATSKRVLRTPKVVPKNLADAQAFIAQLPDDERNLVIHWRMRTSGQVDPDNAHPFIVLPGKMAMTHNGIISGINMKSNPSMCDSRHYIEQTLRPQLEVAPRLVEIPQWIDFVGQDIGSGNRFVFMDNEGSMSFVNRHTGYEIDGMWVANQYSFAAELLFPDYKPYRKSYGGYDSSAHDGWWRATHGGTDAWDDEIYRGNVKRLPAPAAKGAANVLGILEDEVWEALSANDPHSMAELLSEDAETVFATLFSACEFDIGKEFDSGEYAGDDETIVEALLKEDVDQLVQIAHLSENRALQLAQVMVWYGDWVGKSINQKVEGEAVFTDSEVAEAISRLESQEPKLKPATPSQVTREVAEAHAQEELQLAMAKAAGMTTASMV